MAILNGGRILKHTTPQIAIEELEGKIWSKRIEREVLELYQKEYNILSSNYNTDNSLNIRVFASEKPDEDFKSVAPQLDDAYFIALQEDEFQTV